MNARSPDGRESMNDSGRAAIYEERRKGISCILNHARGGLYHTAGAAAYSDKDRKRPETSSAQAQAGTAEPVTRRKDHGCKLSSQAEKGKQRGNTIPKRLNDQGIMKDDLFNLVKNAPDNT